MTNDEAITIIKKEFSEYRDTLSVYAKKRKKAFDMAIKALEQQPCEDAVSRADVLDLMLMKMGGKELYVAVYDLPPVTPQPKTGKWVATNDYVTTAYGSLDYYRCSCCGEDSLEEGDFCPNCGADMREVKADDE